MNINSDVNILGGMPDFNLIRIYIAGEAKDKLDKADLGRMTRDELNDCLSVLWIELDKYYGQQDVCIPILGTGIARMDDSSLTQQELLDIIIASYKLSATKIKKPSKLYILCKRTDDFSLNRIGEYI